MKMRYMQVMVVALLALVVGAQAAVNISVTSNTDGTQRVWTVTDLNSAPPSVAGDNGPASTGVFEAAGLLAGDGEIKFTFTAATNWSATAAADAITTSTLGAYIDNLGQGLIDAAVGAMGIDSSPGDAYPNRMNRIGEALLIELSTSNVTEMINLDSFGFELVHAVDRADILIYHAASNTVTEIQWNSGISSLPVGPWEISDGDIMVVAVGVDIGTTLQSSFRWNDITFDIPSSNEGVIPPVGLTATPSNSLVTLEWFADNTGTLDYYNVFRSTTSGSNYVNIATSVATNTYSDFSVTNGIPYYYVATAVDTNAFETDYSIEATATPFIPVPTNLLTTAGNREISLDWDDSMDYLFDSFIVYRSSVAGSNYMAVASNLTESAYTDSNLVNEVTYFYVVSQVDVNGGESAVSEEVSGMPSPALVIVSDVTGLQGDTRIPPDGLGGYNTNDTSTIVNNMRSGQLLTALSRPVLKFPLKLSDLGDKTTNDIDRVLLRIYADINALSTNVAAAGSQVEIHASQTEPCDVNISGDDFFDTGFNDPLGTIPGLSSDSPEGVYYEIDVTDAVLADLVNDVQDDSAGSAFRLNVNDDLSLSSIIDAEINPAVSVTWVDDVGDDLSYLYPPQLRIEFIDSRPEYDQWVELWLPADVSSKTEDYDMDGFDNLYEYGLDGDPTDPLPTGTWPSFTVIDGGFEYIHPLRSDDTNLVYTVQTRLNLVSGTWTNTGYMIEGTNLSTGTDLYEVTNSVDTVEDEKFIRLLIDYVE